MISIIIQNMKMPFRSIVTTIFYYVFLCMTTTQQRSVNGFSLLVHPRTFLVSNNNNVNKLNNGIKSRDQYQSTISSSSSSLQATVETPMSTTTKSKSKFDYALLFDCDGVILETEELHRIAYNRAFDYFNLQINNEPVNWSVSS
jgi:hypothetical protein